MSSAKHLFKIFFILAIFTNPSNLFAWTGYDNYDGSEIEIPSGSLVREGEEIRFYDWKSQEDRMAQIRSVDGLLGGTRLEIYDYSINKSEFLIWIKLVNI